jgi:hypothetical protein
MALIVEPLTTEERQSMRTFAENLWDELQGDKLGGFSGINRVLYLEWKLREVIEQYGHRDTGLTEHGRTVT